MNEPATRREVLQRGMATGGAAVAAGALAARLAPVPGAVAAASAGEVAAVSQALEKEQLIVIAYRQVVGSSVLRPRVRAHLETILAQELAHVALLERVLTAGGQPIPSPPSVAVAQRTLARDQVHWSLTDLINQHDCLKLLVDVESVVENVYFEAIGTLADPALVRLCAEIMGCEAQHWTILSGLLNHKDAKKAVPYPFVEGTP